MNDTNDKAIGILIIELLQKLPLIEAKEVEPLKKEYRMKFKALDKDALKHDLVKHNLKHLADIHQIVNRFNPLPLIKYLGFKEVETDKDEDALPFTTYILEKIAVFLILFDEDAIRGFRDAIKRVHTDGQSLELSFKDYRPLMQTKNMDYIEIAYNLKYMAKQFENTDAYYLYAYHSTFYFEALIHKGIAESDTIEALQKGLKVNDYVTFLLSGTEEFDGDEDDEGCKSREFNLHIDIWNKVINGYLEYLTDIAARKISKEANPLEL